MQVADTADHPTSGNKPQKAGPPRKDRDHRQPRADRGYRLAELSSVGTKQLLGFRPEMKGRSCYSTLASVPYLNAVITDQHDQIVGGPRRSNEP